MPKIGLSNIVKSAVKWKRVILPCILVVIVFCGVLFAVGKQNQQPSATALPASNRDFSSQAEELIQFQSQYAGDSSKTAGLIDVLDKAQGLSHSMIGLQQTGLTFGITINYELSQNSWLIKDDMLDDNPFYRNAVILFSLIDNLDKVTVNLKDNNTIISPFYTRQMAECSYHGTDVRSFAISPAKFKAFLKQVNSLEKQDIDSEGQSSGTAVQSETDETQKSIEANLKVILSSPAESSNPHDYINAHQNEYQSILKQGNDALYYLLDEFKNGRATGLRGEVAKALCVELLGSKNNVEEGTYSNAQEWYAKLLPMKPTVLPSVDYTPEAVDKDLSFVYGAAMSKYDNHPSSVERDTATIVAPVLYGSVSQGNITKLFVTVYVQKYQVYGDTLFETGGSVIPAAITQKTSDNDHVSTCIDYTEAKDGSYFAPSIRKFCEGQTEIAKKMISGYGMENLEPLLKKNLQSYLNAIHLSPKYYSNSEEKMTFSEYLGK